MPPHPTQWDPFLMLGEDWFGPPGFDWHPHGGFETITYVVAGGMEHADSHGGSGHMGAGDAQLMTAGSGLLHRELATPGATVHAVQLWLNLPARLKEVAPRYQDLEGAKMPTIQEAGYEVRVFAGTVGGVTGPADVLRPTTFATIAGGDGGNLVLDIDAAQAFVLLIVRGTVEINGTQAGEGQVVRLEAGDGALSILADVDAVVLAYGAAPIDEPVVMGDGLVMDSDAALDAAKRDLDAGRYGSPTD